MPFRDMQKELEAYFSENWASGWAENHVLREGIEYTFSTGGKRLRPILVFKIVELLGGDIDQAEPYARAIETFHNFTLVHDDIMDGDTYRRGEPALWEKYGLEQGLNIGDGLHVMAYRYLLENRDVFTEEKFEELLDIFNETGQEVIDGQSMDLSFRDRTDVGENEYHRMIGKKTGALISAALKGGAVIADADEFMLEEVEAYGRAIGPAFQIRDDVIDLVGEKGREENGNDIKEGKRSLIVVKAFNRLEGEEKKELVDIIDAPRDKTSQEDVSRAIELFREVDAIKDADEEADQLAQDAMDLVEQMNHGRELDDLVEITEFLVERKF